MSDLTLSQEDIDALRQERDTLLAERDAERQAREAESRRADRLSATVADNTRSLVTAQVSTLASQEAQAEGAVNALAAEIAQLKRQSAELYAEGKFEEAADVAEKLGDAAARRQQAMQAQAHFKQQREIAARQPVDPVERFLTQNPNFTEAEQAWIKKHPRYATDPEFQNRVNAAHAEILGRGVAPQSTKYFEGLEQAGYMRAPPRQAARQADDGGDYDGEQSPYSGAADDDDQTQGAPAVQTPPRRAAAAPPSRRTPAAPPRNPGPTKLTPDQAEAALAASQYFPEEVQNEGEAAIYAYYSKLNQSPMATRLREQWRTGG